MKPRWLFLTATGSVLSACLVNGEMTIKPSSRASLRDFPLSLDVSNSPALSLLPGLTNLPPSLLNTGLSLALSISSNRMLFRSPTRLAPDTLETVKPGVYLAKPYTILVLVPGERATGDAMKEGWDNAPGTGKLRVIRPEVHLEPLPDNSNPK